MTRLRRIRLFPEPDLLAIFLVFLHLALRQVYLLSKNLRNSSSLSFVSEVCRTRPLPANGLRASSTLSGVDLRTSTNNAELPGVSVAPRSFMNWSLIPISANLPDSAPAPAPSPAPSNGLRNNNPINIPQNAPLMAPAAVRFTA